MFDTTFKDFETELTPQASEELDCGKEEEEDDDIQSINIVPKDLNA